MEDRCIHIDLISAGWINGTIRDAQTEIVFSNSYFDNFPDDFMLAVLTVLGEYPADYRKETLRTTTGPTSSKWIFSLAGQDIHIQVIEYDYYDAADSIRSDKTVVLNKDIFLRDLVAETESVLQRYGLFGYRMEWESEFPLSLFLKIKDIASGKNALCLSVIIPEDENLLGEVKGSDFSAERDILKGI